MEQTFIVFLLFFLKKKLKTLEIEQILIVFTYFFKKVRAINQACIATVVIQP